MCGDVFDYLLYLGILVDLWGIVVVVDMGLFVYFGGDVV